MGALVGRALRMTTARHLTGALALTLPLFAGAVWGAIGLLGALW